MLGEDRVTVRVFGFSLRVRFMFRIWVMVSCGCR